MRRLERVQREEQRGPACGDARVVVLGAQQDAPLALGLP